MKKDRAAKIEDQTSHPPTKVIKCTCKHVIQDDMYGTGCRLSNRMRGRGGKPPYRCTVCGKEGS